MNKDNVVKKNWEFQRILNAKKQVVAKHLILYYLKGKQFKIGISIPKQFANAVNRNYNKNQIRAIIRDITISELPYETVLIARKTFFDLDYQQKCKEVKQIFQKIRKIDGQTK